MINDKSGCFSLNFFHPVFSGWVVSSIFLCSPLPGEMFQFDEHIFHMDCTSQPGQKPFSHIFRMPDDSLKIPKEAPPFLRGFVRESLSNRSGVYIRKSCRSDSWKGSSLGEILPQTCRLCQSWSSFLHVIFRSFFSTSWGMVSHTSTNGFYLKYILVINVSSNILYTYIYYIYIYNPWI